jgi:very-short-patch-repair endonuclease
MARQIEALRRNLLDIGTRNRLVSAPLRSTRANALEIVDEKADQVFIALTREGAAFTFAHNETAQQSPDKADNAGETVDEVQIYVPVDEPIEDGIAARHKDNRLQSKLQAEPLQKRLLTLQHDSVLLEEEQGANILFLALGFIKWFEADSSDIERFAPLILIPVMLERDRVRSRFKLKRREDDIEVNLSLQAKLKQDFGMDLPEIPEGDEWIPSDYYELVRQAISTRAKWTVEQDSMLLGFFSFSKFLLYRDLDSENWPDAQRIDENSTVIGLLSDGFSDGPLPIGEEQNLDDLLDPVDLGHVLDADSSQAAVVKMAADGRNMVVQGPPGTGKSQTIANVIAAAAREGKTILFVAEKMAALQVVHERLRSTGLDALCLELHSHKANKKSVLEELKRTLDLGRVAGGGRDIASQTKAARDRLNELSKLLHSPANGFYETPFQTIALLVGARERGLEPPDFSIDLAQLRGPEENKRASSALEVLASRIGKSGPSCDHPWRGVGNRLTPIDMQRLKPQLERLEAAGVALLSAIDRGGRLLGGPNPDAEVNGTDLLRWLEHFSQMPKEASRLVEQQAFRSDLASALAVLQGVDDLNEAEGEVSQHTSQVGVTLDWSVARQAVAARGESIFRFLSGEFRRSVALLDSVSVSGPTKTHGERIRRLDAIIALQRLSRQLAEEDGKGAELFGGEWQGKRTNSEALRAGINWYLVAQKLPGAFVQLDSAIRSSADTLEIATSASQLRSLLAAFEEFWALARSTLGLDIVVAFGTVDHGPGVKTVVERVARWLSEFDRFDEWFALTASEYECRGLGLTSVVDRLSSGLLAHERAIDSYKFARAEAMWRHMIEQSPQLASLRGEERTNLVEQFRDLERRLFISTAREIAAKHTSSIPPGAQGQMGYVRAQIARRRGHASIRKLVENAGGAVQKIKPIFLMSPISVAQFLPPGSVSFDLVLMDEASQVRPEDAIGAIARGSSVVVVGDTKQLPPTSFFDRTLGAVADEADDESEAVTPTVSAGEMESILTLCQARGLPSRTLQWHYRSRHPSLIQVSSQAFYENKLKFPPSPELAGRDGLLFRRVGGIYDRGKTRTNIVEARAVADAVILHARETPNLSLGVATLSVAQRNAILAELELLRAKHPELESFFDRSKEEAFFVKNLENVQGDERDVIFVSVCYARDDSGYMAQGFGPVSAEGGERRLNVLFTRAKRRCEIFSSISYSDIELRGAAVPIGRRLLHTYLKFAETGQTDVPSPTGREADSDFEIAVGSRIRAAGFEVDYQVGSAGFRIDIGVRDPGYSNSYLIGVECDGATYHSALWARERDRLRQQVLESKGWRLHRIWSTDWFTRPEAEFRKFLVAVDAAKAARESDLQADREAQAAKVDIEREAHSSEEMVSVPYTEAVVSKIAAYPEPHLVPTGLMAQYVADVVSVEQPVHTDEIAKRVARGWGAQRVGPRIRAHVEKALVVAKSEGKVSGGPFWVTLGGIVKVRDRSGVASTTLRHAEYLPPAEIDAAIVGSIERSVAITAEEAARAVVEAFGFAVMSSQLKLVVLDRVQHLVGVSLITSNEGLLRLPAKS